MPDWLVYSLGFTAQLLFSGRTLYQWLASEKSKRVIAPRFFWQLSLVASCLLFIYGYLRQDSAIMLGQSVTYFIYIRNIHLLGEWKRFPAMIRIFFISVPLLIILYSSTNNKDDLARLFINHDIAQWLFVLGLLSQLLFVFRFVYQWLYSEIKRESGLPTGFWIISLSGSLLILLYGIFRKDPVLVAGHLFGSMIYSRNLYLIVRNEQNN